MKPFWKHIARSQKSHPLQPLLIVLTVACSVAIATSAMRFTALFYRASYEKSRAEVELGDLLVSPRGDSNLRLTFATDAEETIGESGTVLGEFRLSGFLQETPTTQAEELFRLSCVDLQAADRFYRFEYLQYGRFTQEELNTSAVLSQSAAERYGLAVGDSFTVSVLGEQFTYTVQAVAADTGLLAHSEALVAVEGMRALLSARIPAIASLGDAFVPYTRLMIRTAEGVDAAEILQRLQEAPAFEKMSVRITDNPQQFFFVTTAQSLAVWLPCILLMLLTALLLVTCLQALQQQRSCENALFCSCGASKRQLSALLLTECAVYAILGTGIGLLAAGPMLHALGALFSWLTEPPKVTLGAALFGALWAMLLMGGCVLWHLRGQNALSLTQALQQTDAEPTEQSAPRRLRLFPLLLTVLFLLLLFLLSVSVRYVAALGVLLTVLWNAYLLLPQLLRQAATGLVRLTERQKRPHPVVLLAWKNIRQSRALRRSGSLLVLLFAGLLTLLSCTDVAQAQVLDLNQSILSDYVAVSADRTAARQLQQLDCVDGVLPFSNHSSAKLDGQYIAFGISTAESPAGFLTFDALPKEHPVGNQLALSTGLARLLGKGVGDTVTVELEGVSRSLVISELLQTHSHLAVYDAQFFGISHRMLLINLKESANVANAADALSAVLAQNGAVLLSKEAVYGTMPVTVTAYVRLFQYAGAGAGVLTLAGGIMVLAQQYRVRKNERHLLRICGMKKTALMLLQVMELLFTLLLVLLFSAVLWFILCWIVDAGIASFGFTLFL